jgi:hypothetical protein
MREYPNSYLELFATPQIGFSQAAYPSEDLNEFPAFIKQEHAEVNRVWKQLYISVAGIMR